MALGSGTHIATSGVMHLREEEFRSSIRKHPIAMVNFYDPVSEACASRPQDE
jgi:hypothetical protein